MSVCNGLNALECANVTFDKTYHMLHQTYQKLKASELQTSKATSTALNIKRRHHLLSGADLKRAYKRIRDSENSRKSKIASEAEQALSRIDEEYEKTRKEVRRQSSELRKVVDKRVQDAQIAHEKQMEEYANARKILEEKVQELKLKLEELETREAEITSAAEYSKEELEALGHTIRIQERRVAELEDRVLNAKQSYQACIEKAQKLEQQTLDKHTANEVKADGDGDNDDAGVKRLRVDLLRYRTQAKILQTILKSKSEDVDQHASIRAELKSSLAEVLNTQKAREHELVECNKDSTRLKMSLKPLLVLNKSPK